MGMTSERAIHILEQRACCRECVVENCTCAECDEAFDMAISTMRKYQKIEDIYYHQSGEALENSLRAVIEDGNDN